MLVPVYHTRCLSPLLEPSFVQFFFQSPQALVAVAQIGHIRLPLRFLLLLLVQTPDPGQIVSRLLVIFTPSPIDESLHHTLVEANCFIRIRLLCSLGHLRLIVARSPLGAVSISVERCPRRAFHLCQGG